MHPPSACRTVGWTFTSPKSQHGHTHTHTHTHTPTHTHTHTHTQNHTTHTTTHTHTRTQTRTHPATHTHTHTHTHTNKHTHIHTYTHTHTDTSKASIVCLKYYTIYYSKDYYASYEYYDPITDYVITNNLLLRTFYYFGFNRTINPQ